MDVIQLSTNWSVQYEFANMTSQFQCLEFRCLHNSGLNRSERAWRDYLSILSCWCCSIHRMAHEIYTVYPNKYAHGFVVLCFVVVMQSFTMNPHEVFIHIHQGFAIVRLPQCQWSKPDGYGKISQCITTTKHSKANTVCIFLGIYCSNIWFTVKDDFWSLVRQFVNEAHSGLCHSSKPMANRLTVI